ncbi:parafibromin-like [Cotesia glomerata]|uniref:Parafibromin n=1 Tax=Cotesia glomerata TaxID=32391 RepID=A0AAV7IG33_COTGL|nr:parafibromin-like [Cotesia glomerata]KAH0550277.1 hypothetical protein KQX54_018531 [Cotesia glomerata]
MADPLSLLREYNVNKKEIKERGDKIIFGEISWPKNIKTNYLAYGSSKEGTEKTYYTLECLIFFLNSVQLTHPVYVRQAAAKNIPVVRRPDRKDLLAYLSGETTTSSAIDKTSPLEIPVQVKRPVQNEPDCYTLKKAKFGDSDVQRMKEQLAIRLDTSKETTVTVDNIKSLSDTLSPETIATIIVKRIAKKRTTIKENDELEINSDFQIMVDMDAYNSKDIISHERQYQGRVVILQSKGKIFNNVFAILQSIIGKESKIQDKDKGTKSEFPPPPPPTPLLEKPAAYNRYVQEKFFNLNDTEGFKINTMGSYHGTISVNEKSKLTITEPLLAIESKPLVKKKPLNRTPIIIIPNSNCSLVTMYNIREILEQLKFVTNEEQKAAGVQKKNQITIQRAKKDGSMVLYQVIDNIQKLSSADWNRVVSVFVFGPTWQFKGWPFNGGPVEVFSKIKAFHVKYDDEGLDLNIASWSVDIIELSRTKRHSDRAAISKYWEILDSYIARNKPFLKF